MQLSGIFVYPIKSCGGIALSESEVVERGLAFDRRYMLIDRAGDFITQREVHRLSQVQTSFSPGGLVVFASGHVALELPREHTETSERQVYRLWNSSGTALRHVEGSRWFSEYLNDEVSLLYMPDDERRAVNPKRARPGDIVSFADGYPMLLISEGSLADLNTRLPEPVGMERFRPNLVVSGCAPYAEDGFASVRIGEVSFRGVKRCERCVITTIDPQTSKAGREPLRTLAKYRLQDGAVWFGMNVIHDGPGKLHVGDAVYLQ